MRRLEADEKSKYWRGYDPADPPESDDESEDEPSDPWEEEEQFREEGAE